MSILNGADLKKSIYYLKRNGLGRTVNAVRERMDPRCRVPYQWEPISGEEKERQRRCAAEGFSHICFSIVVPTYRTPEKYLREMISSVIEQTYPRWELILVDATEDTALNLELPVAGECEGKAAPAIGECEGKAAPAIGECEGKAAPVIGENEGKAALRAAGEPRIKEIADTYNDSRIRYHHLPSNGGIADNTNYGIAMATGDYVGLLDHDDLLAENALYEMAVRIEQERERGAVLQLVYSDEDKCNEDGTEYYEPNFKEKFNQDLFLTNNYICHFMVMRRELIQRLLLRREYDGAQDFDLALRGVHEILTAGRGNGIAHVPSVLYHWRCHTGSTAENPQSKLYAYEAGRRAVQASIDARGWRARVTDTEHLGFYRLEYEGDIFEMRPELAALGGPVVQNGKIIGGRMSPEGKVFYEGLPTAYSGYLHRAALQQDAEALDIRNIEVREELRELFERVAGVAYVTLAGTRVFDAAALPPGTDCQRLSVELGTAFRQQGYELLYLPERKRCLRKSGRNANKSAGERPG